MFENDFFFYEYLLRNVLEYFYKFVGTRKCGEDNKLIITGGRRYRVNEYLMKRELTYIFVDDFRNSASNSAYALLCDTSSAGYIIWYQTYLIHLFAHLAFATERNQRTMNTPEHAEHFPSSLTMAALRNQAFRMSLRITT